MEIIQLKKSVQLLKSRGINDLNDIFLSCYLVILVFVFPSIYVLHKIPVLEIFFKSFLPIMLVNIVLYLVITLLSFILVNSGMLLARKIHKQDGVGIISVFHESLMWIGIFIGFNAVRVGVTFFICTIIIYLGLLSPILPVPWRDYSFLSVLFIILTGLTGKNVGYIYMFNDGAVLKEVNGKQRVSSSLTQKRVFEYKKIDKKTNNLTNILFLILGSSFLLFLSYSKIFLPFALILVGVINYLLYRYSYELIYIEKTHRNQPIVLVRGLTLDVEIDDDLLDNTIEETVHNKKLSINRENGAGGLTKESILGEHWYIHDKPSIIEEENDVDDDLDIKEDKVI